MELGKAEVLNWGTDGNILCCGTQLFACRAAATELAEQGIDVGVINARFVKPLDGDTIGHAVADGRFLVTVEEGNLAGGFGSAVLELLNRAGEDTRRVGCLAIGDDFAPHGDRAGLLDELGLGKDGIVAACCQFDRQRLGTGEGSPIRFGRSTHDARGVRSTNA